MALPIDSAQAGPLWWITVFVIGLVFFGVGHDLLTSVQVPTVEEVNLDELTSAGSVLRKASYSALGLFALLLLAIPTRRNIQPVNSITLLLLVYSGYCVLSLAWSDDPQITTRRLPILGFCLLAVMGVGKHFSPRQICQLVIAVTGAYLLIGIAAEIVLGTFQPHLGDYRFSGTIHPNTQGINCSLLALAALASLRDAKRLRWFLITAVALAIAFLLLTKSRTSCAAFLAAVWAYYLVRLEGRSKLLAVFSTGFVAGLVALFILFASDHFLAQIQDTALLGRTEEAGTFSGRFPLWLEILSYVEHRPWLGYGYGAFWNVERVQKFMDSQGWQIPHAHSGLFEPLANVGILGVTILVSTVTTGLLKACRHYSLTRNDAYAFIVAQVAFGAVSSISDAYYVIPSFCATVCACSFAAMAMAKPGSSSLPSGPEPSVQPNSIPLRRGTTPTLSLPCRSLPSDV